MNANPELPGLEDTVKGPANIMTMFNFLLIDGLIEDVI